MRFGGYWNEAERQAKGLDIIKASIKAGPALKASVVMHDTKPYVCTNMDIFAFVSASVRDDIGVALIKKGMPGLKTSYVLLQNDSKNPFRFSRHYEDGERIISGECTYDSQHPDITFKPTQAPTSNPIITLPPTPTEKPTATPSSEPISDDNWDTNPDTSGEFTYTVSGDEATITRYTGFRTNVMIPTSIDGYKVVAIRGSAFKDNTTLTDVTIPGTVTAIGYAGADEYPNDYEEGVFKGCKRLQTVNFKGGLADLATCIGNRTFYGCSALKKIYFYKDVPQFISNCFYGVTADVYYPSGNSSWTVDVRQDYGGTITWNSWNS